MKTVSDTHSAARIKTVGGLRVGAPGEQKARAANVVLALILAGHLGLSGAAAWTPPQVFTCAASHAAAQRDRFELGFVGKTASASGSRRCRREGHLRRVAEAVGGAGEL